MHSTAENANPFSKHSLRCIFIRSQPNCQCAERQSTIPPIPCNHQPAKIQELYIFALIKKTLLMQTESPSWIVLFLWKEQQVITVRISSVVCWVGSPKGRGQGGQNGTTNPKIRIRRISVHFLSTSMEDKRGQTELSAPLGLSAQRHKIQKAFASMQPIAKPHNLIRRRTQHEMQQLQQICG